MQIESARECSWEARTEADWAQLSTTAGQGPATLAVTVASNPRALSRSTSLVVNDQRLALSQEARPCRFTLSSTAADVGADEGRVTVELDTLEGCAWRASTTASWIRVPGDERIGSGSVVMTVQGNDGDDGRRGLVTVGGQSFTIAQSGRGASAPGPAAPASCTPSVEPAVLDVPSTAQSHSVDLEIGSGCNWTATTNDSWLSLTSPRSGSGEARVQFTVSANTGTATRTGSLTVAGQQVTIRQLAATQVQPCTYTVNPATRSVPAGGGEGTVEVTTRGDCGWTVSDDAGWIAVATQSGQGNATVRYTVQSNGTASSRTGTIRIGGRTHRVTQAAAAAVCSYSLDPSSQTVSASGGEARFRVVTQTGCAWTASGGAAWTTITTSAGTGSGEVEFTVQPNTATQTRAATITAGGQSHALTQAAAAAPTCTYALDPTSQTVSAGAGEARFRVVTQAGCAWTASGGAAWTTIPTGTVTGSGDVVFTVQANADAQTRAATITAGGHSHALTQAAAAAPVCTYALDPASQTVSASGGEARFRVVTQSGCAWTASAGGGAWTTLTTAAGTGSGDVVFTVQPNTAAQTRAATITAGGQSHTVTQAAAAAPVCTYALDPSSQTVSASGGDARFRVVTQGGCAWTASGGAAWTTLTTGAGSGTGDVVFTVQPNADSQTRAATITAGGQSHAVTQAAAAAPVCTYALDPSSQTVSAGGGEGRFRVVTQSGCAWTASGGAAWTSITTGAGSGSGDVVFTVQANPDAQTRAATISAGGQSHALTQAAAAAPVCTYSLDPSSQTVSAAGGEARFRVVTQAGCAWTASGGAAWTTITTGAGTGTGDVVVTVQANTATQTRAAAITAGGQSHALTQAAAAAPVCTYTLDPTSQTVSASGGDARFRVVTQTGCAWTASGGAAWTTITTGAGTGTGDVVVTVQANTATQTRAATISAGGQSHALTQAAAAAPVCTYTLDPTSQTVPASGGQGRFRVVTQAGCAWTASGGAAWTTITTGSGTGSGDVVFTVQANTAAQTRAATIAAGGQSHALTQAAAPPVSP